MVMDNDFSPQEAVLEGLAQGGASDAEAQSPLTAAESDERQDGAETEVVAETSKETPAPRTYTQEEWSARESAKDKENAEIRKQLSALAQEREQDKLAAIEQQARNSDARDVDDGEITQQEAQQRQQQRAEDQTAQQARERERGIHQEANDRAAQMGRALMATELATKYVIDADVLYDDPAISTPTQMEVKAREMALDKRESDLKGTEVFDSGQIQGSGGTGDFDSLSPREKLDAGLAAPQRRGS